MKFAAKSSSSLDGRTSPDVNPTATQPKIQLMAAFIATLSFFVIFYPLGGTDDKGYAKSFHRFPTLSMVTMGLNFNALMASLLVLTLSASRADDFLRRRASMVLLYLSMGSLWISALISSICFLTPPEGGSKLIGVARVISLFLLLPALCSIWCKAEPQPQPPAPPSP